MILTDIGMPDMGGDHLAEKLLEEKPELLDFGSPLKGDEMDFRLVEGVNFLH